MGTTESVTAPHVENIKKNKTTLKRLKTFFIGCIFFKRPKIDSRFLRYFFLKDPFPHSFKQIQSISYN
ncbi:hypothetical protein B1J93_13990 [Leptospira kirschneri serovar Pomona]|uniref:Uncharacterized protein n=1 Tax=Leptospira kirschneri serovar Pomona TaxID=561005 RepID=A0A1T1DK38_9LEPT|nr:hypothetical protein B1J93_13990 [Leptospira kirschneri serovar Pomona]